MSGGRSMPVRVANRLATTATFNTLGGHTLLLSSAATHCYCDRQLRTLTVLDSYAPPVSSAAVFRRHLDGRKANILVERFSTAADTSTATCVCTAVLLRLLTGAYCGRPAGVCGFMCCSVEHSNPSLVAARCSVKHSNST